MPFVNRFLQKISRCFVVNHGIAVNHLGLDQQALAEIAVFPDAFEQQFGGHGADVFLLHIHGCQVRVYAGAEIRVVERDDGNVVGNLQSLFVTDIRHADSHQVVGRDDGGEGGTGGEKKAELLPRRVPAEAGPAGSSSLHTGGRRLPTPFCIPAAVRRLFARTDLRR